MNYLASIYSDIGLQKSTNQDCAAIRIANSEYGKVLIAVICDGMGGLAKGELASATVVRAFLSWFEEKFPELLYSGLSEDKLRYQWEEIIEYENQRILDYGKSIGVNLGTTVNVLLLAQDQYYVLNVGDSRTYEISYDQLLQITNDQTVVAREVTMGNITVEQAKLDPRRNVLLQCVGASPMVIPDFFTGQVRDNVVYMLCSDGFRHEITEQEIFENFHANILVDETTMNSRSQYLVELNKSRNEMDNITVALVRIY